MLRVALKDLMARKRRLVTTSIAVVLGIAFLTGTQLLSTTLNDSIRSLVADVYQGVDAVVRSPKTTSTPFGQPLRTPVEATVLDEVQGVPGVDRAQGFVEAAGNELIDSKGKVFGGGVGPPTITYNWVEDSIMGTGGVREGRGPTADDEIAIDGTSADTLGLEPGDPVKVATLTGGVKTYTLVGVVGLGADGEGKTGAKPIFFTTAEAQAITGQPGQYNFVAVRAEPGIGQREIARTLADALPQEQVITGRQFVDENQESISKFVDILSTFVSVFGYVALFVAIFIIYNTFSILVQQRTRETALLRAVGARRRQVLGASLLEAVVVGVIASVLGLVLGVIIAMLLVNALQNLFTMAGSPALPGVGNVVFALVVGVGITVVSALAPAWRSTRVPPIAALGEVSIDRSNLSRSRMVVGVLMVLVGGALIGLGLADTGPSPVAMVGVGAFAAGMVGERLQVVVVQRGVRVLLGVDYPHQHVDEFDEPVGLGAMSRDRRIVVGQVDEDETIQHRVVALHQVTARHVEPVQELVRQLRTPVSGHRSVGGRTLESRLGEPGAGDCVEQAGLTRPGRPGQRDDGGVARDRESTVGLAGHSASLVHHVVTEPTGCEVCGPAQGLNTGGEGFGCTFGFRHQLLPSCRLSCTSSASTISASAALT